MRTTIWLSITLALGIAGMALAGCGNAISLTDGGTTTNPLLATWVSKGSDVAPLLAGPPFNNVSITATFKADGTYSVESIDTSMKSVAFNGTYVTMPSGVNGIIDIKCTQTVPSSAVAEGILEIDTSVTPNRMQYEVVQTQPTNGLTPPTAEAGFGSTVFNGKQISTLIQKFVRQ